MSEGNVGIRGKERKQKEKKNMPAQARKQVGPTWGQHTIARRNLMGSLVLGFYRN